MADPNAGVLNIDKPQGLTSHDVVNRVRRLLGIRRVGHAGSLDPLATGVLLVCVGQATRIVEYLQTGAKTYAVSVRLGAETDTYDAEGQVTARHPLPALSPDDLTSALAAFRGEISQRPPIYSALKRDGRPLYQLARAGAQVETQPRPVTVFAIDLLAWEPPDLSLRLTTSPGFYVRSLAHDLGQALGCGGHVAALRRLASGTWRAEDSVSLEELAAAGERWPAFLHGLPAALAMLPAVVLPLPLAHRFALGQPVALGDFPPVPGRPIEAGEHRVFVSPERFLGIGRADPEHGLLLPHKTFIDPNDLIREGREISIREGREDREESPDSK